MMPTRIKAFWCCCVAAALSTSALGQPRMFWVPQGGNPADYSLGVTIVIAGNHPKFIAPGGQGGAFY